MQLRLADRLRLARRRQFVGRDAERSLFRQALEAEDVPFSVLFLYGPGGVGKTTLVHELLSIAADQQVSSVSIDCRSFQPTREAFLSAISDAASDTSPTVYCIDTFEMAAPLDGWIRDEFLPTLPANALVVIAGRDAPSIGWRTDPAWQGLLQVIQLHNLSVEDSKAFLVRRTVPEAHHQDILNFTHGHPLALSLVADVFAQRDSITVANPASPDVVRLLLEQFVQQVPGPAHRAALEACAMVRVLNEALLNEMLLSEDAHGMFEWLRGLSFIESGTDGVFPHDLAREALAADVRWRNPGWYAELHLRARSSFKAQFDRATGEAQQRILFDYIFLHRDNPVVRPFLEWQTSASAIAEGFAAADIPAILAMVEKHEGEESAVFARFWLERQPRNALVFRGLHGEPVGYMQMVRIDQAKPDDLQFDPGTASAHRHFVQHRSLRIGDAATVFRFWLAANTYQDVSAVQSLVFINAVRHYLSTPGLVATYFPVISPDFWAGMFAYADLHRTPDADFSVAGRDFGMYFHDWQAVSPADWLGLLAEREVGAAGRPEPVETSQTATTFSRDTFDAAVLLALKTINRPDQLRANPLTGSRAIAQPGAGPNELATLLATAIRLAAEELDTNPRDARLFRVLYHTYLRPAATQEQAAELLDLPFSTYRRYLRSAIAFVTERLWAAETGRK